MVIWKYICKITFGEYFNRAKKNDTWKYDTPHLLARVSLFALSVINVCSWMIGVSLTWWRSILFPPFNFLLCQSSIYIVEARVAFGAWVVIRISISRHFHIWNFFILNKSGAELVNMEILSHVRYTKWKDKTLFSQNLKPKLRWLPLT